MKKSTSILFVVAVFLYRSMSWWVMGRDCGQVRKQLLSFVVCGGGPTGVEVAAELHDMIQEDLSKLYPDLMEDAKVRALPGRDCALSSLLGPLNLPLSSLSLFPSSPSLRLNFWRGWWAVRLPARGLLPLTCIALEAWVPYD